MDRRKGEPIMDERGTLRHLGISIVLGASLVAGACSGSPAASSATDTPVASSSAAAAATAVPTDPPAEGSPLPSDPPATQSFEPPNNVCEPFVTGAPPLPTAEEAALLERMPETVDGEPVREPSAGPAMEVFCSGPDDGDELVQVFIEEFGLDLRTVVLGRFGATVDTYATLVEAFRAPGHDGNAIFPALVALGGAVDPASATQTSVGGKSVSYIENGDRRRYQYVDGDTIWTFTVLTEAQAAAIIAALE